MKIIHITEAQKDYFAGLDPFGFLDRKTKDKAVLLGTAAETDGSDIPTGLMICTIRAGALILRWLYVDPVYRGQGMGDALLSAAIDLSEEAGLHYIAAYLTSNYGRKMVCPDEESFLKYHSFIWEQKGYRNGARFLVRTEMKEDEATPYNYEIFDKIVKHIDQLSSIEETEALFADEWEKRIVTVNEKRQIREIDRIITVGELTSAEVLNREMEEYTAVSLGDITLPMLGAAIRRFIRIIPYEIFKDERYSLEPDWFDYTLSSCIVEDGAVSGLLLIHQDEKGDFWLEYGCNISRNRAASAFVMMKRTANAFSEHYPPETRIIMRCYNEAVRDAVDKLFILANEFSCRSGSLYFGNGVSIY